MSQSPTPSHTEPEAISPRTGPGASGARARTGLAQLTYLLTSRTRQREVFGPAALSLLFAVLLGLDQALGPTLPDVIARLVALTLGVWAGWRAWRMVNDQRLGSTWRMMLLASGGLLAFEALLIVLGVGLLPPFALLLGLFALGELAVGASRPA